jgi:biofilm PGA synthesis protein PgaD
VAKVIYIDAPAALTRRQRTLGTLITAVMWALYGYLWAPLVSLLAWGLGIEFAYDAVMEAGGVRAFFATLFWYGVTLADVIVTVAIWSSLNRWRFANHNRRAAHPRVADTTMAEYFGVALEDVERLRGARRMELDLDPSGRPILRSSDLDSSSRPEPRRARRASLR